MVTLPVSRPALIKGLTVGAGVVSVVVAHFLPQYQSFWSDLMRTVGWLSVGVGSVQVVTVPKHIELG